MLFIMLKGFVPICREGGEEAEEVTETKREGLGLLQVLWAKRFIFYPFMQV